LLEQHAAADLDAAVGLRLQRIQRFPGDAVGVDDVDALRDSALEGARLAELETLVAIDRGLAAANHLHENFGLREELPDGGRRIGIGRSRIVAAERLSLREDHALGRGDIVRGGSRGGEADQKSGEQDKSAPRGAGVGDLACDRANLAEKQQAGRPARARIPASSTREIVDIGDTGNMQTRLFALGKRHRS
jgi:hypothetical protein